MTSELRTRGNAAQTVRARPKSPTTRTLTAGQAAPSVQKETFTASNGNHGAKLMKRPTVVGNNSPKSEFQVQMKRLSTMERVGQDSRYVADLFEKRDGLSEDEQRQFDQKFSKDVLHSTDRRGIVSNTSLSHRRKLRELATDDTRPKKHQKLARRLLMMAPEVTEGQVYKSQTKVLKEEQAFTAQASRDLDSLSESDRQILTEELQAGKRPGLKTALSQTLLDEAQNTDGDSQSFGQIGDALSMLGADAKYQVPSEVSDALALRATEQKTSAKPDKRPAWFLAQAIASSARPEEFSKHAHLVFHDNLLSDQTSILAAVNTQLASGDTTTLDMASSSISDKASGKKQNYDKMKNLDRSLALIEANGNSLRKGDWDSMESLLKSGNSRASSTLGKLGRTTEGESHKSLLGILNRGLQNEDSLVANPSAKAISQFPDRLDASTLKNLIAGGHIWAKKDSPLSARSLGKSADKMSDEDFHSVVDTAFEALPSKNPGVRLSGQNFLREYAEELNDSEIERLSKSESNSLLARNVAFKRLENFEGDKRVSELLRVIKDNPLMQSSPDTTRKLIEMAQDKTISQAKGPAANKIRNALTRHVRDVASVHGIDDGAIEYNGSDVIVIALEGTGNHEPGRTRQIMSTARALRDDAFDTSTLKSGLTKTVENARGIEDARWSGLTEGALEQITMTPEYLDRMQYYSYGSEELTAIHTRNPFDIPKAFKEVFTKETSDGVLQATRDIESLMAQAKAQGRNPKLLLMGHSSGGKGILELLEHLKAKGITSPDGKQLGDTADVFLIDPVAEAHVAAAVSKLVGLDHIESIPGSLRLHDTYQGRAQSFYQRTDEYGIGFGGGIYGSPVYGGPNTENTFIYKDMPINDDGEYESHGSLNYHKQVLGPMRETFDDLLNIER